MNLKEYIPVSDDAIKMIATINIESDVAVYTQIENSIRFAIASETIKAGEKLPSVRDMTDMIQVNPNTVAKVYRDLEVMGLVYARRGMGVFVREGAVDRCKDRVRTEIISRLFEVTSEAKSAGMSVAEIKTIMGKCLTANSVSPYSPAPETLLLMAKKGK